MSKHRKLKPYRSRKPYCRKRGGSMRYRHQGDYTASAGAPIGHKATLNPVAFIKELAASMLAKNKSMPSKSGKVANNAKS